MAIIVIGYYIVLFCSGHPACGILMQYMSNQSVADAIPQLAFVLYQEGIIGTMMVLETGGGEGLLSSLKESVCDDYHHLDKFATILQHFSSTQAIGTLIRKDYSKWQQSVIH